MLVFRAKPHKMLVRIAKQKLIRLVLQKLSDLGLHCFSRPFLAGRERAFCNTFDHIKLPFVFNNFVLSILEWPLKTGFAVLSFALTLLAMLIIGNFITVKFHIGSNS